MQFSSGIGEMRIADFRLVALSHHCHLFISGIKLNNRHNDGRKHLAPNAPRRN